MGSREKNFYNALVRRMGYDEVAQNVQDLYLSGNPRDAARAIPTELIDATCLIGPAERIQDRLHAYADTGVTTLSISPAAPTLEERLTALRTVADAAEAAGLLS
jgi:hypothetical protein